MNRPLLYFDIFFLATWLASDLVKFFWECHCSIYQGVLLLSIWCSYFRFICTQWNYRITMHFSLYFSDYDVLFENLLLLQIIICLRMLKDLLNLQEEWDRGCVATLILSFLSLLKAFVELQPVAEPKYTFCPVECQRGRKIKLITTKGKLLISNA